MTTKRKLKDKGKHRHCYWFLVPHLRGEKKAKSWAKVKQPKSDVRFKLNAAHVRRSIQLGGVGNTQNCSMAVCVFSYEHLFSHPVTGYMDWLEKRCFVSSKDKDGFPVECYEYEHRESLLIDGQRYSMAELNDSKGGQLKLLAYLEEHGDREIHLYPVNKKRRYDNRGRATAPAAGTAASTGWWERNCV